MSYDNEPVEQAPTNGDKKEEASVIGVIGAVSAVLGLINGIRNLFGGRSKSEPKRERTDAPNGYDTMEHQE